MLAFYLTECIMRERLGGGKPTRPEFKVEARQDAGSGRRLHGVR